LISWGKKGQIKNLRKCGRVLRVYQLLIALDIAVTWDPHKVYAHIIAYWAAYIMDFHGNVRWF